MKYILVVDDEPINRMVIEETLMDGYEVLSVGDGVACLESIKSRIPDLLLLDVSMPGIDGLEVCRKLRAEPITKDLPILMLSGYATKEDIEEGVKAGANGYVTKPFTPSDLREEVKKLLG